MKERIYKIRAHHGMCLCFFRGKGYSIEFVRNMWDIKDKLERGPLIQITEKADDICAICPNNAGGTCTAQAKVAEYDRQVMQRCGLAVGDEMSYRDFDELVRQRIILPSKRKEICANCQWDSMCEKIRA